MEQHAPYGVPLCSVNPSASQPTPTFPLKISFNYLRLMPVLSPNQLGRPGPMFNQFRPTRLDCVSRQREPFLLQDGFNQQGPREKNGHLKYFGKCPNRSKKGEKKWSKSTRLFFWDCQRVFENFRDPSGTPQNVRFWTGIFRTPTWETDFFAQNGVPLDSKRKGIAYGFRQKSTIIEDSEVFWKLGDPI